MSKIVAIEKVEEPEIEYWLVADLKPYEKNQKIHTFEDVEKLARMIKRQGMIDPIAVEADGTIIAGHRRRLAQIQNGATTVAVRVWKDLTKEEADEMRIASNRSPGDNYDEKMMAESIAALAEMGDGEVLTNLGFEMDEMLDMFGDDETLSETILASFDELANTVKDDDGSSLTEAPTAPEKQDSAKAESKDLSDDYEPAFQLQITCTDEPHQESLYEELKNRGLDIKVMSA